MCGIAGALGDLRGVDTRAMRAALAHRGPDDEGEVSLTTRDGATLWLGHRRLSIQDLSPAGHQPMRSGDGRRHIVFNGEVYNFRALRAELEALGTRFRSGSDTEVILEGFRHWGDGCIERLRGMFAFALWDEHRDTLTLARDRLGEKPLYLHHTRERTLFASEVRALLASGAVARELDDEGLDAFLTYGSAADPFTLVHGVRALLPGEVLTLHRGELARRRYWSLRAIEPRPWVHRDDAVAQTRARLIESLRGVMVSDVPVAVLLSGGVDSSSNVTLLHGEGFHDLHTFSVTFGGVDQKYSEKPWSDMVARTFGTRHESVEVSLDDARRLVREAVDAQDLPSVDGVNTYLVCDAIRRAGIKVAVSGQGADELFLGYQQRRLFGTLLGLSDALPHAAKSLLARARHLLPTPPDSSYEKAAQALTAHDPVAGAYLAQHSMFSHTAIERLRGARRPSPTRFVEDVGGDDPLDRLSRLELGHYLRNTLLRDGDQMSMAHSLEVRAPYLDPELVRWVVSLPPALKLEKGRNKPLLLDAVGDKLPRAVWDRPKMGFALPYDRWLREGLDLGTPEGPEVGLEPTEVRAVRQRFDAGKNYTRQWALTVLARWARRERMGTSRLRG
jgi:asparagine synthase (glutamine-hydrolysing)